MIPWVVQARRSLPRHSRAGGNPGPILASNRLATARSGLECGGLPPLYLRGGRKQASSNLTMLSHWEHRQGMASAMPLAVLPRSGL